MDDGVTIANDVGPEQRKFSELVERSKTERVSEVEYAAQRKLATAEAAVRSKKSLEETLAEMPKHYFSSDYLEKKGTEPVRVSFLDRTLARLRKRVTEDIIASADVVVAKIVEGAVWRLSDRCRHLEAEVRELKAAQSQTKSLADFYKGVWQAAGRYERGDVVTWQGGMWIALRSTETKPGDGDSGWQLAVKAGRDGKDAR